jgi:hypothetical protein
MNNKDVPMSVNPMLLKIAADTIARQQRATKVAFQPPDPSGGAGAPPPGGDPSGGGAPPPMDPSMGGAPPPMDPSMGGGAPPPMDPSMAGGGMPPPPDSGGGGGPGLDMVLQKLDQLSQALQMSPQNQQGPGGAPGGPGKPGKPDLLAMSMDIFQMKKLLFTIANAMGVDIPQEILDGPNRDPGTGMPMPPGMPGSTSDPNTMAQQQPQQGGEQQSAIPPIKPMQAATPTGDGGPAGKTASATMGQPFGSAGKEVQNQASALAALIRSRQKS